MSIACPICPLIRNFIRGEGEGKDKYKRKMVKMKKEKIIRGIKERQNVLSMEKCKKVLTGDIILLPNLKRILCMSYVKFCRKSIKFRNNYLF